MTSTPIPLLHTRRLLLTPLETDDAAGMVDVLADRALYEFTGGPPPDRAELEAVGTGAQLFEPQLDAGRRDALYASWKRAVERSRHWEQD